MEWKDLDKKPKTWGERFKDFVAALENAPRAFALLWEADKGSTGVMAAVTALGGIMPVGHAWVTKMIIDGVLSAVHRGLSPSEGLHVILPYIVFEFLLIL